MLDIGKKSKKLLKMNYTENNLSTETARLHLGYSGRMISGSKSLYREKHPDNFVIFNSNICTESGKIWYGDIDLTFDQEKLEILANALGEKIYVLYESDARFKNEEKPLLNQSAVIFYPDKPYEIGSRVKDYVNEDLTMKR
jgi:hypothetical protein